METNTAPAAPATLSDNQKAFIRAAKRAGLKVFDYSGRGMFGDKCPAVQVDHAGQFGTRAKVKTDSLGRGIVIYAQF